MHWLSTVEALVEDPVEDPVAVVVDLLEVRKKNLLQYVVAVAGEASEEAEEMIRA